MDTIEAYGLEDLDQRHRFGYSITSHRWNQGKVGHESAFYSVDLRKIGNGLSWDACFHTYSTRITIKETIYFCDDIPVFSHQTQPVSKEFYVEFGGWWKWLACGFVPIRSN